MQLKVWKSVHPKAQFKGILDNTSHIFPRNGHYQSEPLSCFIE